MISNSLYPSVTYSLLFSSISTMKEYFRNSRRPFLPLLQKWRLTSRYTSLWSATGLSIARVPLSYSLAMSPARTASLCFVRLRPSCRSLRIFPNKTWLAPWKALSCIRYTWRLCGQISVQSRTNIRHWTAGVFSPIHIWPSPHQDLLWEVCGRFWLIPMAVTIIPY